MTAGNNMEERSVLLNCGSKGLNSKVVGESKRQKSLGLIDAFSLVYGSIIGSGIFITVSETFKVFSSNNILVVVGLWVLGGIVSLIGGLCYVELGTTYPQSGGDSVYYENNFNKHLSTLFVFMFVYVVKTITLAALSITASNYLVEAIGPTGPKVELAKKLVAVAILFTCYVMNCVSKTVATKAGIFFTVLKTVAVAIIIGLGIHALVKGQTYDWTPPFQTYEFDVGRLGLAMINVLWSMEGWNTLGLVVGDMKNPARDLPIGIIVGVVSVVIVYVLTIVSYSAVLGYNTVRVSETVALVFARRTLGKLYPVIPFLVCCSAIGAANGSFYSVGCVSMAAGQKNSFPKMFSLVLKKKHTPVVSLTVIFLVSLVFIPFKFQILLQYCAFVTWVFYFLTMCALWKHKWTDSGMEDCSKKIFKVNYVFIAIVMIFCVFVVAMCFYTSFVGCSVIASIMLIVYGIQYIRSVGGEKQNDFISRFFDIIERTLVKTFGLVQATADDVG